MSEPLNARYISQVTLPDNSTYLIKDAWAREQIAAGGLKIIVQHDGILPDAGTETMGKLYLIPVSSTHAHNNDPSSMAPVMHDSSSYDYYDEYVTVETTQDETTVYSWEKIGSTDTNLSNYSTISHYHNFNVSIGYTPNGSITVRDDDNGNYTPSGKIDLSGVSGGEHTHSVKYDVSYIHTTTVVESLTNSSFVKSLDSSYIESSTLIVPNLTETEVATLTNSTQLQFAVISGQTTVPTFDTDEYAVNVVKSINEASTKTKQFYTGTHVSNTPTNGDFMYDASVQGETLKFLFKVFDTSAAITDISCNDVSVSYIGEDVSTATINDVATAANSIYVYDVSTVNVTKYADESNHNTSVTYATGNLVNNSSGGTYKPVVTGGTRAKAYDGSTRVTVLSSINDKPSDVSVVVRVGANNGNSTGNTLGNTVSITGDAEFTGQTVQISFDGSTASLQQNSSTGSAQEPA